MARKNLLDIVTTEIKNKEARNSSERDALSKKEAGKKNVNFMLLEIYISVNRLIQRHGGQDTDIPFMIAAVSYYNSE
jgi:hypothetical protein